MSKSILRLATWSSAAALLAGCASDGGLKPQARQYDIDRLPARASLAPSGLSPAAWPQRDWWRRYGDAQLDRIVDEALAGSPGLRAAAARVRQADAMAGVTAAAMAPQVTGAAHSERLELSAAGDVPPPLAGGYAWHSEAAVHLGYDLDFWGKHEAALDAALGRQKVSEAEAESVRLLLTVGLVQHYLKLSQLYAQRDLAEQVLQQRLQVLALTQQRVAAKIDAEAELKQAELAVPLARNDIVVADEAIALVRLQLAALIGTGPDRGASIARPQLQVCPAGLPAQLPSTLLARRPDVVAQRWRVESLRKDIDVAHAQFYPTVDLNGLIGLQAFGLSHFLQGRNTIAGLGAGMSLPIFDGGRLRSSLALRDAEYDQAVEAYNQTLVDALRDVASQLVSIQRLAERNALQAQALDAARQAYDFSLRRYRSGVGNYLQVLATQLQVLNQQRAQIDLDTRAFELDMQLARALGGGYAGLSLSSQ